MLCALLALWGAGRDSGCVYMGQGCVWCSDSCAALGWGQASLLADGFSWILEMREASFLCPDVEAWGPGLLFLSLQAEGLSLSP